MWKFEVPLLRTQKLSCMIIVLMPSMDEHCKMTMKYASWNWRECQLAIKGHSNRVRSVALPLFYNTNSILLLIGFAALTSLHTAVESKSDGILLTGVSSLENTRQSSYVATMHQTRGADIGL
jgi:hypothetical protein